MSSFTVTAAPPDALFNLTAKYKLDTFDKKVDLGIGAYRDDNGKPWILPVVAKADKLISEDPQLNHEYLPIAGLAEFRKNAARIVFGKDSPLIAQDRIASVQTISGTGANHLGGAFLKRFAPNGASKPSVYLPDPTWGNHKSIFENIGLEVKTYPYYDNDKKGLKIDELLETLSNAQKGDIVLLHACAHNPTGMDPTQDQWKRIAEVVSDRKLFPFFDSAYQGFASGSLDQDAWAIRYFAHEKKLELLVCQSFSKNFGLYGERAGNLHVVVADSDTKNAIVSQLEKIQRAEISNPPSYGAKIAAKVLSDDALYQQWNDDLNTMSSRIKTMRTALKDKLVSLGTPGTWDHIVAQIGMFSYTGLTGAQVDHLVDHYHIYLLRNGRISVAGLNTHNVDYVAKAIDETVRNY